MKALFLAILLSASVAGCGDYPGHQPISKDAVRPVSTPTWGKLNIQDITPGGDCHIDTINDEPGESAAKRTISRSASVLKVTGWGAISVKDGLLASNIALALRSNSPGGTYLFAATTPTNRPDVAAYFKNSTSAAAGFTAMIDLSDVDVGEYTLEVIQHREGKNLICQYTPIIGVEK